MVADQTVFLRSLAKLSILQAVYHVAEELNHILLKTNLAHGERWVERGWQSRDRDPVSRTNFNKIHASRFESVIVGETSGKRNFHNQTQTIHESRIPHEINHASHAFRYSRITFVFK